jgi:hypothetical protein
MRASEREREMAAAWTDVIHQRALEVHVRCVRARRELADAKPYLANPMLVADGMAARARIYGVLVMVTRAAIELDRVSYLTKAAELLALRGRPDDPAALHRAHPRRPPRRAARSGLVPERQGPRRGGVPQRRGVLRPPAGGLRPAHHRPGPPWLGRLQRDPALLRHQPT